MENCKETGRSTDEEKRRMRMLYEVQVDDSINLTRR